MVINKVPFSTRVITSVIGIPDTYKTDFGPVFICCFNVAWNIFVPFGLDIPIQIHVELSIDDLPDFGVSHKLVVIELRLLHGTPSTR